MKKIIVTALVALFALNAAACGSDPVAKAKAQPKAKVWTVAKVQKEYNSQLESNIAIDKDNIFESGTTVDTTCLLKDGTEGEFGTLKCHVEYSSDETFTVEIDVDKKGMWIANSVD